jgi:hypothetical protein
MFRFNNPDAMLVLLMVAGAYAVTRAIENGSTKWLMLAGVFVGFGFLAKMLQALLVVPAFPEVRAVRLDEKGRGRALKHVWTHSDATVLAYLDVDLSTDLGALLPLVAPLISGHSDLAIGSRLARGSRVVRGPKREFISRGYKLLLRGALAVHFSDAQCGFKAIRSDVAAQLLPMVGAIADLKGIVRLVRALPAEQLQSQAST